MDSPRFETLLESLPLRTAVRERFEVRRLRALTEVGRIPEALHITCGNGEATELILKHFEVGRMIGLDRDAAAIELARRRREGESLSFRVQEGPALPFPDSSFDAVFDLADLHNYAGWREGLGEIHRVLRPGGLLILEELSRETFSWAAGRLFKALTDHPYEEMLGREEFRRFARGLGFDILRFERKCPLGLLTYFLMVARKATGPS